MLPVGETAGGRQELLEGLYAALIVPGIFFMKFVIKETVKRNS